MRLYFDPLYKVIPVSSDLLNRKLIEKKMLFERLNAPTSLHLIRFIKDDAIPYSPLSEKQEENVKTPSSSTPPPPPPPPTPPSPTFKNSIEKKPRALRKDRTQMKYAIVYPHLNGINNKSSPSKTKSKINMIITINESLRKEKGIQVVESSAPTQIISDPVPEVRDHEERDTFPTQQLETLDYLIDDRTVYPQMALIERIFDEMDEQHNHESQNNDDDYDNDSSLSPELIEAPDEPLLSSLYLHDQIATSQHTVQKENELSPRKKLQRNIISLMATKKIPLSPQSPKKNSNRCQYTVKICLTNIKSKKYLK